MSLVDITEPKQRERELNAVASISIALRAVQSVDELVTRLLDESLKLIGASTGSIWLNDASNGKISQVVQRGAQDFTPLPVGFGQGIVGRAMERGAPFVAREFKSISFITEEIVSSSGDRAESACLCSAQQHSARLLMYTARH